MNEGGELQPTEIVKSSLSYWDRISALSDRFAEWEDSVQKRLELNPQFDGFNKQFVQCELHYLQLTTLSDSSTKMMIRYFSAVGRNKLFGHGDPGPIGNIDKEASLLPEAVAMKKLQELKSTRGEAFTDEFDELVLVYLQQIDSQLGSNDSLAEMAVKCALNNLDKDKIKDRETVNLMQVMDFLEFGEDGEESKYELNQQEREISSKLSKLRHPAISYGGFRETRFPYSVSSAISYVYRKAYFNFLAWSHADSINLDEVFQEHFMSESDLVGNIHLNDGKLTFKHPNALEESIQGTYYDEPSERKESKMIALDRETFGREIFDTSQYLSSAPLDLFSWYKWEKFDGGKDIAAIYDYPGINDLV